MQPQQTLRASIEHGDTLRLVFVGQFHPGASWPGQFWFKMREGLGAKYPRDMGYWGNVEGGYELLLNSGSLKQPLAPEVALNAVRGIIQQHYSGEYGPVKIQLNVREYDYA